MGRQKKARRAHRDQPIGSEPPAGSTPRPVIDEAPARPAIPWVWPAVAAVVVYAVTLRHGFVYDDPAALGGARTLGDVTWVELLRRGRIVTYLVHWLDLALWQDWAPGFHLTNVILHAAASALAAAAATAVSGKRAVGLWCGLFFAVHPVHVEVVASIANRKDAVAAIFAFGAVTTWCRARSRGWKFGGTTALLVGGLLSKEVAVIGVIPALWFASPHFAARLRPAARGVLAAATVVVVGGVALWFMGRFAVYFRDGAIAETSAGRLTHYGEVLVEVSRGVYESVRMIVAPLRLMADYPIARPVVWDARALAGVGLAVVWAVGVAVTWRRASRVAFALVWIALTWLPTSNLVPLSKFFHAERYLYVPSFGACLLVGLAIAAYGRRRGQWFGRVVLGAAVVVAVGLAARSVIRAHDWRDDRSLWTSAFAAGADTSRVRFNLGTTSQHLERWEEAAEHYRAAIRHAPDYPRAHWRLGRCLERMERPVEAVEAYRRALALAPDHDDARDRLATLLPTLGRDAEAAVLLRNAVEVGRASVDHRIALALTQVRAGELDAAEAGLRAVLEAAPGAAEAHAQLGNVLARRRRFDDAAAAYRRALERAPKHAAASKNLGNVLLMSDRIPEAASAYERAVEIAPNDGDAWFNLGVAYDTGGRESDAAGALRRAVDTGAGHEAMTLLARLLATAKTPQLRDLPAAETLARRACEASDYGSPPALLVLATAQAEAGRNTEALETARRAAEVAVRRQHGRVAEQAQALIERLGGKR